MGMRFPIADTHTHTLKSINPLTYTHPYSSQLFPTLHKLGIFEVGVSFVDFINRETGTQKR